MHYFLNQKHYFKNLYSYQGHLKKKKLEREDNVNIKVYISYYRISFPSVCYSIKSNELKFANKPYIYIIRNIPYINKNEKQKK